MGMYRRLALLVLALIALPLLAYAIRVIYAAGGIEYNAIGVWVSSQFFGQLAVLISPLNVSDPNILSYINTYVIDETGQPYYSFLFSSYPPVVVWLEGSVAQKIYSVFYGGTNPYPDYVATPGNVPIFAAFDEFDYDSGMWNITGGYTVSQSQLQLSAGSYAYLNASYEPKVVAMWLLRGARTGLAITLYSPATYVGWVHIHLDESMFSDWNSIRDGSDIYFLDAATLQPLNYSVAYLDKQKKIADLYVHVAIGAGETKTIYMLYGQDNPYAEYRVEPARILASPFFEHVPTVTSVYRIESRNVSSPGVAWISIAQNVTLLPGTAIAPHLFDWDIGIRGYIYVDGAFMYGCRDATMVTRIFVPSTWSHLVGFPKSHYYGKTMPAPIWHFAIYMSFDMYNPNRLILITTLLKPDTAEHYNAYLSINDVRDRWIDLAWGCARSDEKCYFYVDGALAKEIDVSQYIDAGYIFPWEDNSVKGLAIGANAYGVEPSSMLASYVVMYCERAQNGYVVNASSARLFLDPTFYDGSKYIDLSGKGNHGTPFGDVKRVPATMRWLWIVPNLYSDGYLHLRFFPFGSIVRIFDASTGSLVAWVRVVGYVNPVGLVEDLVVPASLPRGNYTIVAEIPVANASYELITAPPYSEYPTMPHVLVYRGSMGSRDTAWRTSSGGVLWWEYSSANLSVGIYVPGTQTRSDLATEIDVGNVQPFLLPMESATAYSTFMALPLNVTIETTATIEPNTTIAPHLYDWYFDGEDDYIKVPHSDVLNVQHGNRITIEVLAYLTGWQNGYSVGVLIDKRSERQANYNWEYDSHVMIMRIHANDAVYGVAVPHELYRWNHYVMVLNGSWLGGYLNGELKASNNDIPETAGNDEPLTIGCSVYRGYYVRGIIAMIRIYNRALSEPEIEASYRNHIVNASGLALFLDPTFYNGTHYINLVNESIAGAPYGEVRRVLAEKMWLWVVYNASNDSLVHLRFFPLGTVVRFFNATSGELVKEVVVANITNSAGLVEDYVVELPSGTYRIVAILAPHSYQVISADNVYLAINYAIAPHLYDLHLDGEYASHVDVPDFDWSPLQSGFTIDLGLFVPQVDEYYRDAVVHATSSAGTGFFVIQTTPSRSILLGWRSTDTGESLYVVTPSSYPNRWVDVAFVWDTQRVRIYVDGALAKERTDGRTGKGLDFVGLKLYRLYQKPPDFTYRYLIIHASALSDADIVQEQSQHIVSASNLALFLDPTFFNGTHYLDLSHNEYVATPYGGAYRVPATMRWLWIVPNLYSDGYLHLRFFPFGSIVRLFDTAGRLRYVFFVLCTPNGAGLCEDYRVRVATGVYNIEVLVPYPPVDLARMRVKARGDLEARDSYVLQVNATTSTSVPMILALDIPATHGLTGFAYPMIVGTFWRDSYGCYGYEPTGYGSPSNDTAVQVRFRYEPGERLAVAILNVSMAYDQGVAMPVAVVYSNGSWLYLCYVPDDACTNTSIRLDRPGWYLLTIAFEKPNRIRILLGNGSYVPGGIYQDVPREFVYSATIYGEFVGTYALGTYVAPSDYYGTYPSVEYDWARIVQWKLGVAEIGGADTVERVARYSFVLSGNATTLGFYFSSGTARVRIIVPRINSEPVIVSFGSFETVMIRGTSGTEIASHPISTSSLSVVVGNETVASTSYYVPRFVMLTFLPNGTGVVYVDNEPVLKFGADNASFREVLVEVSGDGGFVTRVAPVPGFVPVSPWFFEPLYTVNLNVVSTAPSIVPVSTSTATGVVVGWRHDEAGGYVVCGANISSSVDLVLDVNGTIKSVPLAPATLPIVIAVGYDYDEIAGSVACFAMAVWMEGRYTRYSVARVEAPSKGLNVSLATPFIDAKTAIAVERFAVTLGWALEAMSRGALSLSIAGPIPVGGLVKYVSISNPMIIDMSDGELRVYPGGAKGITLKGFKGWILNLAVHGSSVTGVTIPSDSYTIDVPVGFTAMIVVDPSSRQVSIVSASPPPLSREQQLASGQTLRLPNASSPIVPPPPLTGAAPSGELVNITVLIGALAAVAIASYRLTGEVGAGLAIAGFVATVIMCALGNYGAMMIGIIATIVGIAIRVAE